MSEKRLRVLLEDRGDGEKRRLRLQEGKGAEAASP